jgi:hypothetical protein
MFFIFYIKEKKAQSKKVSIRRHIWRNERGKKTYIEERKRKRDVYRRMKEEKRHISTGGKRQKEGKKIKRKN